MWINSSKKYHTSLDEEPMSRLGYERQGSVPQSSTRHTPNRKHPRAFGWDQETLMPEKGAKSRGEIIWLAALAHEKVTDSEMGALLERLEGRNDLDEGEQANVREFRKRYDKATKLSGVCFDLCTSP